MSGLSRFQKPRFERAVDVVIFPDAPIPDRVETAPPSLLPGLAVTSQSIVEHLQTLALPAPPAFSITGDPLSSLSFGDILTKYPDAYRGAAASWERSSFASGDLRALFAPMLSELQQTVSILSKAPSSNYGLDADRRLMAHAQTSLIQVKGLSPQAIAEAEHLLSSLTPLDSIEKDALLKLLRVLQVGLKLAYMKEGLNFRASRDQALGILERGLLRGAERSLLPLIEQAEARLLTPLQDFQKLVPHSRLNTNLDSLLSHARAPLDKLTRKFTRVLLSYESGLDKRIARDTDAIQTVEKAHKISSELHLIESYIAVIQTLSQKTLGQSLLSVATKKAGKAHKSVPVIPAPKLDAGTTPLLNLS